MTDNRKHRGAHPKDAELFSLNTEPLLRIAVQELCWLLDRGYATPSSLKLVGDRHGLRERQRTAVKRSSCLTEAVRGRNQKHVALEGIEELWIDGFNLLTSIEVALSGGVILTGRDGCCRDMASMHGTYRKVEETRPALELIGQELAKRRVQKTRWLLDQPVSNSGRLAASIREIAQTHGWNWEVDVVADPDPVLIEVRDVVVASADSMILDGCESWTNLAAIIVGECPDAWVVSMSEPPA